MNEIIKEIVAEMVKNGFYENHFTKEQIKMIKELKKCK